MPFDDFFNAVSTLPAPSAKNNIIVIFTGGEPLLRNDLEECGFRLRQAGFRWGMVTNGVLYDEKRHIQLLNAGMGSVTVSLDGTRDSHEWLRQTKHGFDQTLNAIRLIGKTPRLNGDVVTCVHKRNIEQLEEMYDLLSETGIASWRLFTITPIGRAASDPELLLSDAEVDRLMQFIVSKRALKGMKTTFSCEAYTGAYEELVRDGFFFCRAGIHIASVLADGSISACPNVDRSFIQGNIYKDNLADVWKNRFEILRNREWMHSADCADCKDVKVCGGSGLHWWHGEPKHLLRCLAVKK